MHAAELPLARASSIWRAGVELIRFRPDQNIIFPRFANYYFQTECYWACIRSTLIQATIENFSAEKYKDLNLPLPPKAEQKQIASFLDWKTGQIDALIARKKELLENLKEKRIAVITQAVTQGLNPAAPMRDSGILWLGQVPQHWKVKRLRFLLRERFTNGLFKKAEYWGDGCRIVNVTDLYVHNDLVDETLLERLECDDGEERWPRLVGQPVLILKWRLACAAYAAVCRADRLS